MSTKSDKTAAEEPERLDAPNQQVVRADGSGPGDEGTGGPPPDTEDDPVLEHHEPEPEPEPEPDPEPQS